MKIPKATKQVSSKQQTAPSPPKPQSKPASDNTSGSPPPQAEKKTSTKQVKPTAPVNRSPSAATGGGGLDDLFGFGNQEGRMKIPRASNEQNRASKSRPIYDKNPVQKPSTNGKK